MARDLATAQRFYGAVAGWTFRPARLGEAFTVAELDGVPVAGIGALAADLGVPVAWTPYFAVDEADVAVDRIRERSGTIAVGPVSFETGGRGALVADRDGAVFGIWEGPVSADWRVGEGQAPAWLELRTRNAFDAAIFYGEVLEWATGRPGCCEVSYEEEQVVLRRGGEPVARLNSGPVEAAAYAPHARPRWHVHFRVPELEPAVEAAASLGGRTVSDVTGNATERWVALRDPDGALFTLTTSRKTESG
ncbi:MULTISPECIES: VOC family protein [unclassified Streptomyces]|uniref:VOC family protein n=1 Tax=unclassified Streptomyces TaxID=2593676 RepID=UPI001BE772D9|nr:MULTISPECIES: VOC family protein [unclassified Streptomyces]MBT2406113.1 VOC family protein [Streptomyces sp. ISL-21]MBT2457740.1 VOC family protein [Streptomyces sp. ISL-86]MBT2609171.1 VOC family protein [Streptomyces sp. ISL-87]